MRTVLILLSAAFAIGAALRGVPEDLSTGWRFARGRADERLHARHGDAPEPVETVSLPHRVLLPNRSLWYTRTLTWPAGHALEVDADDGAQVFVDGERLEAHRRWFFHGRSAEPRPSRVTIRVLNNAVNGGLRRVAFAPLSEVPGSGEAPEEAGGTFPAPGSRAFQARMPAPGQPCDFTLWADSQGGWDTFSRLVAQMGTHPHHFSAGVGDLVDDGSEPEAWRRFLSILAPLTGRAVVVPVVGNHDYDGYYNRLEPELYARIFDRRTWAAWTCGPARFVAVDVNGEFPLGISPGTAQHAWLRRETSGDAWRSAGWRVLLVHQPPWSVSWTGYDGDEAVRHIVEPLVREGGLDLVVSGHSHAYEHLVRQVNGRRLDVLITGGAGGNLEDLAAERLDGPGTRVIVRHHFVRGRASRDGLAFEVLNDAGLRLDAWSVAR